LLPWRTIVISLPLLSPFVPVLIGLGTIAGIIMVGLFVLILALVFTITTLLHFWFSPSLTLRLISGARSLAVATPIIVVMSYWIVGFGLGHLIWQWQQHPNYTALFAVVSLPLIFDIVLGFIQMIIFQPGTLQPKASIE
jgi:hypothetical protein